MIWYMYILQNDSQYVNILNVNTFSFSQKFNFVCVWWEYLSFTLLEPFKFVL